MVEHSQLLELTDEMAAKEHEMRLALLRPFPEYYVFWKVQTAPKEGNRGRGMMVCYVDARAVEDRLDEVFGPTGWTVDYEAMQGGIKATLYTRWPSGWLSKPSTGEDKGLMAQEARALKRAAVKIGVGRYLYRVPKAWVTVEKRGRNWYPARGETPLLEDVAPWALPGSTSEMPDVPYWEADVLAEALTASSALLPEPELPPLDEDPRPARPRQKVAPGTGKDPRELVAGTPQAAKAAAKAGQAGEHVQGRMVLKDDPKHPVPPNWKALYDRALEGELGEYKGRPHVQNAVRELYPGFARRAKAEKQDVTIKEAWDVLRFRTLSPEAQAVVIARHGLEETGLGQKFGAPAQGDSVPATGETGDETGNAPAENAPTQAAKWNADLAPGGGLDRWGRFCAQAGIAPTNATAALGVAKLTDYAGTLGEAVMAVCDHLGLTYQVGDEGVTVDWPPAQ